VNGDDAAAFPEEPQHASIQFAHVAQFKQAVTQCLRERLPGDTGGSAAGQPCGHRGEVVGICGVEFQEEFLHRAFPGICFVKLYRELPFKATSILMYLPGYPRGKYQKSRSARN